MLNPSEIFEQKQNFKGLNYNPFHTKFTKMIIQRIWKILPIFVAHSTMKEFPFFSCICDTNSDTKSDTNTKKDYGCYWLYNRISVNIEWIYSHSLTSPSDSCNQELLRNEAFIFDIAATKENPQLWKKIIDW